MKVSLSMWSVHKYWYEGKWDTVDFIDFAATTKATGVELLSCFWKDMERDIPRIDEALKKHGLAVASFCACNNFIKEDEESRIAQLKEVTDAIDAAVHFGTPIVRVFSGDKHNDEMSFHEGMMYVLEGLTAAARYAERKGVILCLENHGLFAGRSDQIIGIIRKVGSDALRSTFDTGNFMLVGQNSNDAIQELKPFVKHVHVKDFVKVDDPNRGYAGLTGERFLGKIAGEGDVDLRYILGELKKDGYDGWLSVEFEGEEEQKLGATQAVSYTADLVSAL